MMWHDFQQEERDEWKRTSITSAFRGYIETKAQEAKNTLAAAAAIPDVPGERLRVLGGIAEALTAVLMELT